jgi:nucleotide-binding universal stress UspA family protein
MSKRLLCATDGSHASEKAVDFAIRLAKALGAHIAFLTVERVSPDTAASSAFWDSTVLGAAELQVHKELHTAASKARESGLSDIKCITTTGQNIAAAIIDYTEKHGYDHIIMGSVGRTGVARLLLGSIATEVVAKAHCPVTIVR